VERLVAAALIIALAPLASEVPALVVAIGVTALLGALALWETRAPALRGRGVALEQA
jgi:hypothetical protein